MKAHTLTEAFAVCSHPAHMCQLSEIYSSNEDMQEHILPGLTRAQVRSASFVLAVDGTLYVTAC